MKILITGASGFVGTHLADRLSKSHKIIGYDIKEGRDIFNSTLLAKNMKGVDTVIHLAAFVSGIESWNKPEEYLENNGMGTFRVIEAAIKCGVKRIIIFSSAAVYGKPLTPYGASKLFAEAVSESYKDKIETIVVRPFNIYGKGQNPAYGYAIHNFYRGIKNTGNIEVYGDGSQTRDFVYIDDVVDTVEFLLTSKVPDAPLDIGTGKEIAISELANEIGRLLNKPFKVKKLKFRNEIKRSKADTKALNKLGINVSGFKKLKEGLRLTLE